MKNYVIDTNILLDDPNCIERLYDEGQNKVFIPFNVILELDKFKKNPEFKRQVSIVAHYIKDNPDKVSITKDESASSPLELEQSDRYILNDCKEVDNPTLVTNDVIFQALAEAENVPSEEYKNSQPTHSESSRYTGLIKPGEDKVANCFYIDKGSPIYCTPKEERTIHYENTLWKTKPRSMYQNMMMELIKDHDVNLMSVQSEAGYGKSYVALAGALQLAFQEKTNPYKKVFVVKPLVEIGAKLGYLPGDVDEKIAPFNRYITDLITKLHETRPANKIFKDKDAYPLEFNPKFFELLPITYVRGLTIENAVVILDECQNMSRSEMRAILSRMGSNVKCICLGDVCQVDAPNLNEFNNGLTWLVEKCKGAPNYAHIVLKGAKSRGPICDLIRKVGL